MEYEPIPDDYELRVLRSKGSIYACSVVYWDPRAGQNRKWYVHHNIEMKDQDMMIDMGLNLLKNSDVIKYVDSLKPRPGQWGKNNQ